MKNAVAYFLVLFYAIAMFKPVLPVLKDFLAHTFTPKLHIVSVHNEKGSKHVHYETAQTATTDTDESKAANKFSSPVSEHVTTTAIVLLTPVVIKKNFFPSNPQFVSVPEINIVAPPPKCTIFFI